MNARPVLVLLVLPLLVTACAPTEPRTARTQPSAAATCLEPSRARSFSVLDDDVLLVDAGVDHYRLRLEPTCVGIDFEVMLRFRGDPITGRVCGMARDAILTDRGDCHIHDVEWITKDEYKRLSEPKSAAKP